MTKRLSAKDRRSAILEAVVPLFAEKGFHGVRTREIAEAASVSEALIFKHFPSKEALYHEIWDFIHSRQPDAVDRLGKFATLRPSTDKLMLGIHFWVEHMATLHSQKQNAVPRLMLNSLLEDGEFARVNLARFRKEWFAPLGSALEEAIAAGDAIQIDANKDLLFWLTHHLTAGIKLFSLPEPPAVDYQANREVLIKEAVRFILRGLGVKPEAIADRYNLDELMNRIS